MERQYPLLSNAISAGKHIRASFSSSVGGHWNAVVILIDDGAQEDTCNGWAQWSLYRGHDPDPVKTRCTTGELAAPGQVPNMWFLPGDASSKSPLLVAVPSDTCRYELLEPEQGIPHGVVIPAFGNVVNFERVTPDLLVVHSTDWYGVTRAYQQYSLSTPGSGPVFILADRNPGDEIDADTARQVKEINNLSRLYVPAVRPAVNDSEIEVEDVKEDRDKAAFSSSGDLLEITDDNQPTTIISVPPWGKRLIERLRKAVHAQATNNQQ